MKAFLSHSSRDKHLVDRVAALVGGANIELDSVTFDRGILNVAAIEGALKRCALFVLFLSSDALNSNIVRFEALLTRELIARGVIERFLVICLDNSAFNAAEGFWKDFNFVRKGFAPESIARLIQHHLVLARSNSAARSQPFVGRGKELNDTKEELIDASNVNVRAIYISGNAGIGRRTFARHLFRDVYPSVNSVFPEIAIDELDGYDEIYRKLLQIITPTSTLSALRTRIMAFSVANDEGKASQIASLLDALLESREAVFIEDHGGLLDEVGGFQAPVIQILQKTKTFPHPAVIFIAERMMPPRRRGDLRGVIHSSLPSLTVSETRQLIGLLLREYEVQYTSENLGQLVELSDGHPFNARFVVELAAQYTLPALLSDTSEVTQWKRNRASHFLRKIIFSAPEINIISALRDFNTLDFNLLAEISEADVEGVGKALTRLIEFHIIEGSGDTYTISPPLRIAAERDRRFSRDAAGRGRTLNAISRSLLVDPDESEISLSTVDAAILAKLQEDDEIPELFSAFLLPSHYVWLAQRRYHDGKFADCIQFTHSALAGMDRLSPAGRIEACRLLCLASARLGQDSDFHRGIGILGKEAKDARAKSNVSFLLGFRARMNGHLPEAEELFRKAIATSPGNHSAARELASICLVRGYIDSAEQFARRAFEHAQDNAFILDILLSVLINSPERKRARITSEIEFLFERLARVGDEEGRSFYTTRRAEYQYKLGKLNEACKLIDEAVQKTPWIFNVHALRSQIYLDRGNRTIAFEEIEKMRTMVYRDSGGERRSNLRALLQIEASYYAAYGEFGQARQIYETSGVFTPEERQAANKGFDVEEAFRNERDTA